MCNSVKTASIVNLNYEFKVFYEDVQKKRKIKHTERQTERERLVLILASILFVQRTHKESIKLKCIVNNGYC